MNSSDIIDNKDRSVADPELVESASFVYPDTRSDPSHPTPHFLTLPESRISVWCVQYPTIRNTTKRITKYFKFYVSVFQIHVLIIKEWQVMRGWWWVGGAVIIILSRIWPTASAHAPARTSPSSAGTQPSSAIRLGIAKIYSYGTTGTLTLFQVRKSIDHPTYRYPFFMSVLFLLIFH